MPAYRILAVAALVAAAQAITITSPSTDTTWNSDDTNTITWTSVSTDPTTVDIYLVHQASQPQINDILFSSVAVSGGSADISGLQLPTGSAYQINFVKSGSPDQIYAQSGQFDIEGTASDATSTLSGYSGPTYTPTSASGSSTNNLGSSTALTSGSAATAQTSTTSGTTMATSTGTSAKSTGTTKSTSTSTSATTSATHNAAVEVAASAPLAALVFGAVALFV